MRRFYTDKIDNGSAHIDGAEARHMTRVLRMAEGDAVVLFDGSGYDYPAVITGFDNGRVSAKVTGRELSAAEPGIVVDICQAVIKHDHFGYAVQKCTELGAHSFTPFLSERCVKRPKSGDNFVERAQRVSLEAAKQCGRSLVPRVGPIIGFGELADHIKNRFTLLCYEGECPPVKEVLQNEVHADIMVVVGPEGGFAPDEAQALIADGARAVSLGKLILRAESAGPAAMAMLMYEYGGRT